jgi:hypothetical protein
MHLAVFPIAHILPAIAPVVGPKTVDLVTLKIPFVVGTINPTELSESGFLPSFEQPSEFRTIWPNLAPLPMLLVKSKLSLINPSIGLRQLSITMLHIIKPLAYIVVTSGIDLPTTPANPIMCPMCFN